MKYAIKNYIRGEFLDHGEDVLENINPANEESIGSFPQSTQAEVDEAYDAARKSFKIWKGISRLERAEYFYKIAHLIDERREDLAKAISLETGKNYNESIAEVNEALHMAQYAFGSGRTPIGVAVASEVAEKDGYMLRKPKGVIAIVSPFNFPIAIGPFWCAAPAIVEGNTVIIKPSEDAPLSTQLAAQIYHEAGVPPGVFNVVHGDGEVGDMLVHKPVDHVCFTGSAEVGQHVRKVCAESWHKTSSCEMGSKSAVIVFDDANLDLALSASFASVFKLSGQRCVSSGRLIVHRDIMLEFVDRFMKLVGNIKTGPPLKVEARSTGMPEAVAWDVLVPNKDMYYGPLINKQALDKVKGYNQLVEEDPDTTVLMMGKELEGKGHFMSPTIYTTEWRDTPFLKNEVFGPHVAIIPFDSVSDAVDIYNDTDYGLAVGVVTEDFKKARYCRDNCDFGMCYWNGGSIAAESHLGFGGVKKSGNGYPSAARTYQAVTHEVSWTVNHGEDLVFPQGMK